ncbi:LamG-like jellyroll fold domain-containing protein [Stagnihabitans tardus]|uniref:VPLPA-CTERM sorting domain-containing protein n=1 Tax=Stagnihabitans tardus TaxID=2699202 RepID=A0AAE4YBP1_9RHOB|nr:LamG-like jellyroll fold domain-containing protein [Stagnihabitans tardus]NBZ89727.1 VPLPA-CTERM sorting domain-containing protein [Stagnihabitans tardus]
MRLLSCSALMVAALALPAPAATLYSQFLFDGTTATDSLGHTTATETGAGTVGSGSYNFGLADGLDLNFGTALSSWSLVLRANLDDMSGWRRVLATDVPLASGGFVSDEGLYFRDGNLNYCCGGYGSSTTTTAANTDFVLAVVFDGSLSKVFLNGALQFSFPSGAAAHLPHATDMLRLFNDQVSYTDEEASGKMDYLEIYDGALTDSEVLARTGPMAAVPLPATGLLLAGALAGLAALRRKRLA